MKVREKKIGAVLLSGVRPYVDPVRKGQTRLAEVLKLGESRVYRTDRPFVWQGQNFGKTICVQIVPAPAPLRLLGVPDKGALYSVNADGEVVPEKRETILFDGLGSGDPFTGVLHTFGVELRAEAEINVAEVMVA